VKPGQYLPQVREQYEALPYPPRDPEDEKTRIIRTWLDDLAMINHYCFAGKQSFRDRFRVLVAGGGTGDSTIFLAEQLRHTDAEIVHLDISHAATELARRRAEVRGLKNISWVIESLLALPELDLGKFDYINCLGVLHHLDDPDAGLRALRAVCAESGALGIMVYAQYGRTGVYQMQDALRKINEGVSDAGARLANARDVLANAPPTNWFLRGDDLFVDHKTWGDSGVYDLLLHSRDRAYTVAELYEWIADRHGLHVELTYPGRGRSIYLPEMVVAPQQPAFLRPLATLAPRARHEIAELLAGNVIMHTFYAVSSAGTVAPYGDADYVPCFCNGVVGERLAASIRQHGSRPYMLHDPQSQLAGYLDPGKLGEAVARHIDGRRDFREIFSRVREEPGARAMQLDDQSLFADFQPLYGFLRNIDRLLLRHRSVEPQPAPGP
jgi:SAM-dependent methyltransferase